MHCKLSLQKWCFLFNWCFLFKMCFLLKKVFPFQKGVSFSKRCFLFKKIFFHQNWFATIPNFRDIWNLLKHFLKRGHISRVFLACQLIFWQFEKSTHFEKETSFWKETPFWKGVSFSKVVSFSNQFWWKRNTLLYVPKCW